MTQSGEQTDSPLFVQPGSLQAEAPDDYPDDGAGGVGPSGTGPDGPWGVNPATGRPYTRSPEDRAAWGERMAAARAAAKAAGRSATPPKRRSTRAGSPTVPKMAKALTAEQKYAQTAAGLLALPAMGLAIAARVLDSKTLAMDSAAVSLHVPPIAEAVGSAAVEADWLGAALEKAAEVGPWSAVVMATLPLLLQIGANHGAIKPSVGLGILTEDELFLATSSAGEP
jgi:hypothetical protein